MKRVNFHLTSKEIEGLEKLSEKTGLSKAELVRRAIDDFFRTQRELSSSPKDRVKAVLDAYRRNENAR